MRNPKIRDSRQKEYSLDPFIRDSYTSEYFLSPRSPYGYYVCGYCSQVVQYTLDHVFNTGEHALRVHYKGCNRYAISRVSGEYIFVRVSKDEFSFADVIQEQIQMMIREHFTPIKRELYIDPDKEYKQYQKEFELSYEESDDFA